LTIHSSPSAVIVAWTNIPNSVPISVIRTVPSTALVSVPVLSSSPSPTSTVEIPTAVAR
jgi:hypothetical protein